MKTTEIILIASLFVVAGIRLYKKYGEKKPSGKGTEGSGSYSFPVSSNDEEYEPYSGKKD